MGIFHRRPNVDELKKKKDVEGLLKALRYKEASVRAEAAESLGQIGDKRAVEPLIQALEDEDTKGKAMGALRKIGGGKVSILKEGTVLVGREVIYVPAGDERKFIDAWNDVSLGMEADQLVAKLLEIAYKEDFLSAKTGSNNRRARTIGEKLYRIGGIELMLKAWWKVEVEKYRTGLHQSRELDRCWDLIGEGADMWLG